MPDRNRKIGLAQLERFANQRESRVRHHRVACGQIAEKARQAWALESKVRVFPLAIEAITNEWMPDTLQHGSKFIRWRRHINQCEATIAWLRVEHFLPQDWRQQIRAFAFHRRTEERRDQI